jgi:O-antigen ligase
VQLRRFIPWPIGLAIVMITCSTFLAISRNIYQSDTTTSFKGVLFNLVHFRPIDWHANFMPISDWMAYALAISMVSTVIAYLHNYHNKNQIIFRPLIIGLLIAVSQAMLQAITGLGLPESLLTFRKDFLGHATIGFQPDLHAFAGHMLLGAVGLFGYLKILPKPSVERSIVILTIALCWLGLILSKSRSLLLLALLAMIIWMLYFSWKEKKISFPKIIIAGMTVFIVCGSLLINYSNSFQGVPVLSWLGELSNEFKTRDLTSWSLFSGIFGSRFEIWEAAIRMWWEFPLFGTGQGTFYRYSAIPSFSKSHFLILNNGENAHNYFLQSLTETGCIGVFILGLAVSCPFFLNKNIGTLKTVIPLIVAMALGNLFSHTFLVRENLFLGAVIFAMLYSQALSTDQKHQAKMLDCRINLYKKRYVFVCLALTLITSLEIFYSFGKPPFTLGLNCYKSAQLTSDGWTKGLFLVSYPVNTKGVEIVIEKSKFTDDHKSTKLLLELKQNNGDLVNNHRSDSVIKVVELDQSKDTTILIEFADKNTINVFGKVDLEMQINGCYSPRDVGESIDSRLLGIKIKSIRSFF